MDVFWKEGSSKNPVIMFLYGGAWMSGSKALYRSIGFHLASQGYTVIIPEYRLFPEVTELKDMLQDILKSMKWSLRNCNSYNGDSNKFHVIAHSAGAHLAAHCFLSSSSKGSEFRVKGLLLIGGVYDISQHYSYETSRGVEEISAMGRLMGNTEEGFIEASPLHNISDNLSCKVHLVHGLNDKTVPASQSINFYEALKSKNVESKLFLCNESTHTCHLLSLLSPTISKQFRDNSSHKHVNDVLQALIEK